jgi:hypothetical protein
MRDAGIRIGLDGDQWCALIGGNLQEGLAGFGATLGEAIEALGVEVQRVGWNF